MARISKNKYIIFRLGRETYGVPVGKIKTVERKINITPLLGVSCFIKGVTNLRGRVVPIFDLKKRLAIGETVLTPKTCAIILELRTNDGIYTDGLVVDEILAVQDITKDEIEENPACSNTRRVRDFIVGTGNLKGKDVTLLDLHKILEKTPDSFLNLNMSMVRT